MGMDRQERKERKIMTENRKVTIDRRETSFEGLVTKFENGEDGIYNIIEENKNAIFQPKVTITKADLEDIPLLAQLRESINYWEGRLKTSSGREAYIIKKTLIDLRKDQYLIKAAYRRPITPNKLTHAKFPIPLEGTITVKGDQVETDGIELTNPAVCSAILCNYSRLKEDSWDNFYGDTWYLIYDFERTCDRALEPYPLYMRIVELKIDGCQNAEIQAALQYEFGIKHSFEHISSLWRQKIPKLIAQAAEDEYLEWYYTTKERGEFKKCSRCGRVKLRSNRYFSKNKTSSDGFYSICKCCRSTRKVQKPLGQIWINDR